MAKKRLNKKLAIIGSAFFIFVVLSVIVVVLHLSRDPDKFIQDGDQALRAAAAAVDPEQKEEQLELAVRSYGKAYRYSKTDERKLDMLFKLVEAYKEAGRWLEILGCWKQVLTLDGGNVPARFGRLKFAYITAHTGARQYWKEIDSQASEFLEKVDEGALLEYTAEYDPFDIALDDDKTRLGPYLYMVRGRALAEMGKAREVTDPMDSFERGIADLKKAVELEPQNVNLYRYLAEAVIAKGEVFAASGQMQEKQKTLEEAENILKEGLAANDTSSQAHISLMNFQFGQLIGKGASREEVEKLEPQYQGLLEKFGSDAYALTTVASFYRILGYQNQDKAIEYCEKAMQVEPENVDYARMAANLYYEKASIYNDRQAGDKAIEMGVKALQMPDAIVRPGPREWANKRNRIHLTFFLANCYTERALEAQRVGDQAQNELWVEKAEGIVHEIEQLMGSGEDPSVVRWQGMLDLAKGDSDSGASKLYATYEQYKASGMTDFELSYVLAKLFENTQEIGAVGEFYASALSIANRDVAGTIDRRKPEALLDYAQLLNRLRAYGSALVLIDYFENQYWENDRSRYLRIRTNIAARQFQEAQDLIEKLPSEDVNSVRLKVELAQSRIQYVNNVMARKRMSEGVAFLPGASEDPNEADISTLAAQMDSDIRTMETSLQTLLVGEPNAVSNNSVTTVANWYVDKGQIQRAKELADGYLAKWPEDPSMQLYRKILDEPEPGQILAQPSLPRSKELEDQVLSQIKDPMRRAMNLGLFYNRNNEPNLAIAQLSEALQIDNWDKRPSGRELAGDLSDYYVLGVLFDLAVNKENWILADKIQNIVRSENMDGCQGNLLAARIAIAKADHAQAVSLLDQCLRLNPISSKSYLFRSVANEMSGHVDQAIDDAIRAAALNPLDPAITEHLAIKLFERNMRLGSMVTAGQLIETEQALIRAMTANPADQRLQGLYAEHIKDDNPDKAIAIRQRLQNAYPSVQNSVLLGRMAMELGDKEINDARKKHLFDIAERAFEQAMAAEPQNAFVLESFGEYYRRSGQEQKAEQLLSGVQDARLMWSHYYRAGKFENAMRVLEQEYQKAPKDKDVLRGLVIVAEKTVDQEGAAKYSDELLAVEDTIDNRLLQIQTFLNVGLINETENKLQSLKEKYPSDQRIMLFEGWWYLKRGQLDKALELANQYLQIDQDNPVIWRLRGEAHSLMTNYDQAVIDLKKSKTMSDNLATRLSLARAYLRAGRSDDAVTELKAALELDSGSHDARLMLEQTYIRLRRVRELAEFYSGAMKEFPEEPYWFNQAAAGAVATQNWALAEALYSKAWEIGRGDLQKGGEAFYRYLEVLLKAGKTEKLFEEANKYVDTVFGPVAFFRMGQAYLVGGDRDKAVEYCRKAVEKAGDNESLVNMILSEMAGLLGYEDTMKYCVERLEKEPESLVANLAMFYMCRGQEEFNKAVEYIDVCLKITGDEVGRYNTCMIEKAVTLQMAYAKTAEKSYLDRAIETYEGLLVKTPNSSGALNNLAYLLAENEQKLAEALKHAEYAHRLSPNDAGFMDTYAYTLYKNGEYGKAEEMLVAAVQKYEDNRMEIPAEVYEHLGMAKEKLGKNGEALTEYKRAMEAAAAETISGTNERIKAAIERLERL